MFYTAPHTAVVGCWWRDKGKRGGRDGGSGRASGKREGQCGDACLPASKRLLSRTGPERPCVQAGDETSICLDTQPAPERCSPLSVGARPGASLALGQHGVVPSLATPAFSWGEATRLGVRGRIDVEV